MAKSVAGRQFPQIVWRGEEKYLWNPVYRQALKNRPEERVRLRVLEYLLAGRWSKHRISTEQAIDLPQREAKLRTDLLCYTRDFSPLLLVECKAENVRLSTQTAEQVARYNQQVQAPFLLLTNGHTDYWYSINEDQAVRLLDAIPEALPAPTAPSPDFEYWKNRGVAGSGAAPGLRRWLQPALKATLQPARPGRLRYLSFKQSPTAFDLANYYCILPMGDNRLAIGFTATPYGGCRLIIILNDGSRNRAVLEGNLDLLLDGQAPNTSIYWAGGPQNIDLHEQIPDLIKTGFNPQKYASTLHGLIFDTIS